MIALTERRGEGLDDATIMRKTRTWIALQYVRIAVVLVAWVAALYAFRLGA